jgi:hypothetical protein
VRAHAVAGLVLLSELDLPELLPSAEPHPDETWTLAVVDAPSDPGPYRGAVEDPERLDAPWVRHEWSDAGTYRIHWPDQLDARIDRAGRRVELLRDPALAEHTLRHLVIDQVVPHLCAVEGRAVVHASAVAFGSAVVGLVGPSGSGKSSLAGALVEGGARLVCDDYLVLDERPDGYRVAPAYPGLRLWSDSAGRFAEDADGLPPVAAYSDKRRLAVDALAEGDHLRLAALVALGEWQEGSPPFLAQRLGGADAFLLVFQQAIRLPERGREAHEAALDRFSELVRRVPVLLVEHVHRWAALPEVLAGLRDELNLLGVPTDPR